MRWLSSAIACSVMSCGAPKAPPNSPDNEAIAKILGAKTHKELEDATFALQHPFPDASEKDPDNSKCSSFGLLTPLLGISNRNPDHVNPNYRDTLRVTGPVESGIGGGYYWSKKCEANWSWGTQVFGFSEGLNPASKFQVGVGAGLQIDVKDMFAFGIAVGYDLVRSETIETGGVSRTYENGLLLGNDVFGCSGRDASRFGDLMCAGRNFTWLLTFSVNTGGGGSGSASSSGSAGTGASPGTNTPVRMRDLDGGAGAGTESEPDAGAGAGAGTDVTPTPGSDQP